MRKRRDEHYILDLCDSLLGLTAIRQHRFPFLRGDKGHLLPVDAYYPELQLVIEYHERQHEEHVALFDDKPTVSGVPRWKQRRLYDERRRNVLPLHNISLLELRYSDFTVTKRKRLVRTLPEDCTILRQKLRSISMLTNAEL